MVSGHKAAVERAVALAPAKGAKRAVMLTVSAPFHCALMAPAAAAMRDALAKVAMRAPAVPVVANVEAAPLTDPAAIRDALVRQVTATVRWRECVAAMAGQGVDRFYEIGAGKVLTGLVRRIAPARDRGCDRHAGGCGGVQGGARLNRPGAPAGSALKAARETILRKSAGKFRKIRYKRFRAPSRPAGCLPKMRKIRRQPSG